MADPILVNETGTSLTITVGNDVLLANAMPQAEYMYGCTPTAVGMVLGYYDLYGYRGKDYSDLIEGVVALDSRGSDGNKYNMNEFDSALGRAIATEDYVYRFFSRYDLDIVTGKKPGSYWTTSGEEELEYSFTNGGEGPDLRTDVWNCLADYLGTGQVWRGNGNYATSFSTSTLETILNQYWSQTYVDSEMGISRTIDGRYTDMLYGLYLYVQEKGYSLDVESTGTYTVDVDGGDFTFEDYMLEIDAGRPVLISITGHSMVGYGYNAETREIIFDDCYDADKRMAWDGFYEYSNALRSLESITVIRFMNSDDIDLVLSPVVNAADEELLSMSEGEPVAVGDYCFTADFLFANFTVSNLGSSDCDPFAISVYLDGKLIKSFDNVYLEANSDLEYRDVPIENLDVGLHSLRVVVDEANTVSELTGTNNAMEQKVMVLKEGSNIVSGYDAVCSGEISCDDYVTSGWQLHVLEGGIASETLVRGIVTDVSSEGLISLFSGLLVVSQGGLALNTTVYEYGQLQVAGVAKDVLVREDGEALILSGATVSGIHVASSGTLDVMYGGMLTGPIKVEEGAIVYFESGAALNIDLTGAKPGSDVCISGLSGISGNYSCTLTVDGSLSLGQYALADGAAAFDRIITVTDGSGTTMGSLMVGSFVSTETHLYSLKRSKDVLLLNIKNLRPEKPVASADVTEPTDGNVLVSAEFSEDSFKKEYSLNGTTWFAYTEPVELSENGTVYFRAKNEEGFVSEIASCRVDNIDKTFLSGFTLNAGETASVHSGQTYFKPVLSGGMLYVLDGGVAKEATVGDGGDLLIYSGGTASGPVVERGGRLDVLSGGTAAGIVWTPCEGTVNVNQGAHVDFASGYSGVYYGSGGQLLSHVTLLESQAVSRASMYVMDGGTANAAEVGGSGFLYAFGGTANGAVIHSGGRCYASGGGTLNGAIVESGGNLIVSGGGVATGIVENGGYVAVQEGAEATFASHTINGLLVKSSATVHSGTTAGDVTVDGGRLFLYSGGKLTGKIICMEGTVSVFQGGVLDFDLTQVEPGAGARLNDYSGIQGETPSFTVTVNADQAEGLYKLADGVTLFDHTITVVNPAGAELGTLAVGETKSILACDFTLQLADSTLSLKIGDDSGFIPATSEGLVLGREKRTVESGERFHDTVIASSGVLYVADGGVADGVAVNPGGSFFISSGGSAKGVTVNSGGSMCVYGGGMATRIKENGGQVEIKSGAESDVTFVPNTFSNHIQILTGATLHSGTSAVNTTLLYNAALHVYEGGAADGTKIGSGGILHVSGGGAAIGTTVSGGGILYISSGGTGVGAVVGKDGRLYARQDGKLTGSMTFDAGAVVTMYEGSVLDFDLSRTSAGAAALVNDLSAVQGTPLYTLTVDGTQKSGIYTLAEDAAGFNSTVSVLSTNGEAVGTLSAGETLTVGGTDYTLNLNGSILSVTVAAPELPGLKDLVGTKDKVSWDPDGSDAYIVNLSTDDFEHMLSLLVLSPATDMLGLPAGTYQWRVKPYDGEEWAVGETIVSDNDLAPKVLFSAADGNTDAFFAVQDGVWEGRYAAKHVGSLGDWAGTNEIVSAKGKGRIHNLFSGSGDYSILFLTDQENGDALFLDDVFTELPGTFEEQQARISRINEIRAGAGDDIVDLTSQQFEFAIKDLLLVSGGDGDDVIWANKGSNCLLGDAGNDRIVGASGNDVIAGGVGNDSMHGGGGTDIFTFCENWGVDTVEQTADGFVMLWLASGDESNWNTETLTYTDGENSVTVSGVSAGRVELIFGDDGSDLSWNLNALSMFDGFSAQRIFESGDSAVLASL